MSVLHADLIVDGRFWSLDPLHQAWRRGIERFALVVNEPVDLHTVNAALAQLREAGLSCRSIPGRTLYIQGGRRDFEVDDVHGYEQPFAITEEPEGRFTAAISGTRGFRDEETYVASLEEAVGFVLRAYRARGALPVAHQRR